MSERAVKAEVWLPLTQGKVTVVDFDDFEKLRETKWYATKMGNGFYAVRGSSRKNGKQKTIYLHRAIVDCPPDKEVNHINGDGLDNRRENLQICTEAQNQRAFQRKRVGSTSKFRGVCWHKRADKWQARIHQTGKGIHLGLFESEEAAARAYDAKARELFGEYAAPNFPIKL